MTDQPKLAAIQTSSNGEWQRRLEKAEQLCRAAAEDGAQLLVLPENFAYYGQKNLREIGELESSLDGPVTSRLSSLAEEMNVWIVGGTLPLIETAGQQKPFATSLIFDNSGTPVHHYNKMHLFDVDIPEQNRTYRESDSYLAGSGETLVFDCPLGRVGVVICYDLRFPHLALALAAKGADIIVAPSAFTRETGKAHWQLLLQSRALDTLCYLVGANLAGRDHLKIPTWGGSTIVDPWGKVLAQMDDEEGFISVEIDREKQQKIRQSLPVAQHRRQLKNT